MALPRLANITVGVTAIQLTSGQGGRWTTVVTNNGTSPIYIGFANTVTVAAGPNNGGTPVAAGGTFTVSKAHPQDPTGNIELWGIAGSNQDVRVQEFG